MAGLMSDESINLFEYIRGACFVIVIFLSLTDPLRVLFSYWTISHVTYSPDVWGGLFTFTYTDDYRIPINVTLWDSITHEKSVLQCTGTQRDPAMAGNLYFPMDLDCPPPLSKDRYTFAMWGGNIYTPEDKVDAEMDPAVRTTWNTNGFPCRKVVTSRGEIFTTANGRLDRTGRCLEPGTGHVYDRQTLVDINGEPCTGDFCYYKTAGFVFSALNRTGEAEYHEYDTSPNNYMPWTKIRYGQFRGSYFLKGSSPGHAPATGLFGLFESDSIWLAASRQACYGHDDCASKDADGNCERMIKIAIPANMQSYYSNQILGYGIRICIVFMIVLYRYKKLYKQLWHFYTDPTRRLTAKGHVMSPTQVLCKSPIINPNVCANFKLSMLTLLTLEVYLSSVDIHSIYLQLAYSTESDSFFDVKRWLKWASGCRLIWAASFLYVLTKKFLGKIIPKYIDGNVFSKEDVFLFSFPFTLWYIPQMYLGLGTNSIIPFLGFRPNTLGFYNLSNTQLSEGGRRDYSEYMGQYASVIVLMALIIAAEDAILLGLKRRGFLRMFTNFKADDSFLKKNKFAEEIQRAENISDGEKQIIFDNLRSHYIGGVVLGLGLYNADITFKNGWVKYNGGFLFRTTKSNQGKAVLYALKMHELGHVRWESFGGGEIRSESFGGTSKTERTGAEHEMKFDGLYSVN